MLNIALPELEKHKRVKDLIINVLAMKYPLTSKKVYNEIKKRFAYSVTYQAVHKAIRQLLEQGTLVREGKEYYVSIQWIEETSDFIERMKESYKAQKKYLFDIMDVQTSGKMQMITFSNFLSAELFNLKLIDKYCSDLRNKAPFCANIQHIKRPIFQTERAYETLKVFKKTKVKKYIIVRGNTFVDKWCTAFYRGAFDYVLGVDVAKDYETYILGDTVTQLYIPTEISRKIDFMYNTINKIDEVKLPEVYSEIYEGKCKVQLLIYKNQEIAEQLRHKTLNYFKTK